MNEDWQRSLTVLRQRAAGLEPRIAVVLGSGLGALAEALESPVVVPYRQLPGFPTPTVPGHAGRVLVGRLEGVPVLLLQGRSHFYETGNSNGMETPLRTVQAFGCDQLVLTNAAGSLRPEVGPGGLMLISDHIGIGMPGPLIGCRDPGRFVDLAEAYDPLLRDDFKRAARTCGLTLHQGVYMWFAGPNFETPAEIRAARSLGADAVGMSTVAEVIIARFLGIRVAAVSVITNLAAGLSDLALSHEQTLAAAQQAGHDFGRLLRTFIGAQQ